MEICRMLRHIRASVSDLWILLRLCWKIWHVPTVALKSPWRPRFAVRVASHVQLRDQSVVWDVRPACRRPEHEDRVHPAWCEQLTHVWTEDVSTLKQLVKVPSLPSSSSADDYCIFCRTHRHLSFSAVTQSIIQISGWTSRPALDAAAAAVWTDLCSCGTAALTDVHMY